MNQFRRCRLWVALLVCYASGTGCEIKAVQIAKPSKPKSTTEPLVKTRIVPPSDSQPVDPTKAVLVADAPDLPTGATLLDPNMVWDMWNPNSFAISPDGQSIAYISRGALWLCSVKAGPPKKLADLPNTTTAYMAMPEHQYARTNFKRIRASLGNAVYNRTISKTLDSVYSLAWTRSQDGVIYGLRTHSQSNAEVAVHKVMHVSTKGTVSTLATIKRDVGARPHSFSRFHVAADQRFLVAWGYTPLIWDIVHKRPRATCFDTLLPSASSHRFLGIEIDTRQLVIANADFKIVKRLDVTFPARESCDLFWSKDERFAICRRRIDYSSRRWEGFRINLETGEKRSLNGGYITDRFTFTGRGSEVIRTGIEGIRLDHSDGMIGAYLAVIPDGDGPKQLLKQFSITPPRLLYAVLRERPYYPLPIHNSKATLFAMALPRKAGSQSEYAYHLLDRNGNRWAFPNVDKPGFVAPYDLIAFANGGESILARKGSQLFSIPVATLQKAKGANDE